MDKGREVSQLTLAIASLNVSWIFGKQCGLRMFLTTMQCVKLIAMSIGRSVYIYHVGS